jgi:hypothetical protein
MFSRMPKGGARTSVGLRALLRLLFAVSLAGSLGAIAISVSGSWSEVIDAADLQGGAGSDLNPSIESPQNRIALSVSQASKQNWAVSVSRIDGSWWPNLQISVKRTSNGTGTGTISGGTAYLAVTSANQSFFTGNGNRSAVYLRLQLNGLSANVPPAPYTTTIVYTVVQTI